MKKIVLFINMMLIATLSFAQLTPDETFTPFSPFQFETVVRTPDNKLAINQEMNVKVEVSRAIGYSVVGGNTVYNYWPLLTETHSTKSNRNGLISLMIGEGDNLTLSGAGWNGYVKMELTITFDSYEIKKEVILGASPIANYAEQINTFDVRDYMTENDYVTGYYNNLSIKERDWNQTDETQPDYIKNKPEIPAAFNADCSDKEFCDLVKLVDTLEYYLDSLKTFLEFKLDTCPATVTDIDGNVYNTVNLYGLCWMKENLRVTKMPDGTPIEFGDAISDDVLKSGVYRFNPDNNPDVVENIGYLYSNLGGAAGDVSLADNQIANQGICPDGWHIPSMAEFKYMLDGVYAQYGTEENCLAPIAHENANYTAKYTASEKGGTLYGYWFYVTSPSCAFTNPYQTAKRNITGFSAMPAGYYNSGTYNGMTKIAAIVSNTGNYCQWNNDRALVQFADTNITTDLVKGYGMSVRCLKNY